MWLQKQNKKQDLDPVINLSTNLARCRVTSLMWFSGDSRSLPFEVEALGATHPDWAPHTRNFCLRSTDCFGDNWPKERIFSELHKRGGSSIEFLIWRCVISFLFQRLSMIVTALQLNSHYIFFSVPLTKIWTYSLQWYLFFLLLVCFLFEPRWIYTTRGIKNNNNKNDNNLLGGQWHLASE